MSVLSDAERAKRYRDRRRAAAAPVKLATDLQDWVERAAATLPPMNADDISAVGAIAARIDARIASNAGDDSAA